MPDFVLGANDGVITTLAVVSGVVGAALPASTILILGFANLLADGLSMAASNILARRSTQPLPALRDAARHGVATFVGFVAAGVVPLIIYLTPAINGRRRFAYATILGLMTLAIVGASRALLTERKWYWASLEMLSIGSIAAAAAYAIGAAGAFLVGAG